MLEFLDWGSCGEEGSNYGTLGWSVLPPGPTCTWTVEANGFDKVQGPSPVMSVWLITLIVLGIVARRLALASRTEREQRPNEVTTADQC